MSTAITAYIARAPRSAQAHLRAFRRIVRETVPAAEEKISYGMPYYSYHGRLAYFAYFRDHVSFFAMASVSEFRKQLGSRLHGKSTIRFSFDEKLPVGLLRKIVKARARRNEKEA
jgi:uncharacterized protein YdhG (YjbR/CyaY superfamily)